MKRWERFMRAAALSLLMLFSISALLPFVSSSAHTNETTAASKKGSVRRHSRAWWRRYRARQRRRRAALERKRALAGLRQRNADRQSRGGDNNMAQSNPLSNMVWLDNDSRSQSTPIVSTEHSSRPLPKVIDKGVRLNTPDGRTVGQVSVSVIGNAGGGGAAATRASQRRALGAVQFASLRRTVIDKMLVTGGWVVNDFEREISGRRVYVVLAQSAGPNDLRAPVQSWTFYFTEVDGRIYNIVSNVPLEFSDRMGLEAERVIATLGADNRPADKSAAAAHR
ncbi:MAG TPA: hypothetical protein VE842_06755 [Pyrinomonadaceae bacterium]|nr:hypothetical protein [Pyrinomonadaceae bacterium]